MPVKEEENQDEAVQEVEGTFTWLKKTLTATEEETYKDAGHEVLLYLAFLKYSAVLFISMFLLGGLPLMFLYLKVSHDPNQQSDLNSWMERITIKSYQGV